MESPTSLISLLAAGGVVGVFAATLLERLVPVVPSYLLLIGIGIAAAPIDGSLAATAIAAVLGSALGCGFYYLHCGAMPHPSPCFRSSCPACACWRRAWQELPEYLRGHTFRSLRSGWRSGTCSSLLPDTLQRGATRKPTRLRSRWPSLVSSSVSRQSSVRSGGHGGVIALKAIVV